VCECIRNLLTLALGIGNQVSVEFNLLYRWHSAISRRDEAWSESLLQECIDKLPADSEHKGKSPMDLEGADLREIFHSFIIPLSKTDCSTWTLRTDDGELKRKLDGSFDDTALNNLITSSTQDLGGMMSKSSYQLTQLTGSRRIWCSKCTALYARHRNGRHQYGTRLECSQLK
jgi:hypothetical protein